MIKTPKAPGTGVVTGLTLLSKLFLVRIFLEMAPYTGALGIFVPGRGMAVLAGDNDMATQQRESRTIVIKPRLLPGLV